MLLFFQTLKILNLNNLKLIYNNLKNFITYSHFHKLIKLIIFLKIIYNNFI